MVPVLETILSHPEQVYKMEQLADLATMSRSAFAAKFAATFGRPPMSFVRATRLRRAASLLEGSTMSVEAIARNIGYTSRSHFSSAFKEEFGVSPSRFGEQRPQLSGALQ
jgi:AraC-like DNA-binding protein